MPVDHADIPASSWLSKIIASLTCLSFPYCDFRKCGIRHCFCSVSKPAVDILMTLLNVGKMPVFPQFLPVTEFKIGETMRDM